MNERARNNRVTMTKGIILLFLIYLAISRWLPGSDPLMPETSSRGVLEIVLLVFAVLITVLFFGIDGLLVGFKSPTFVIVFLFSLWAVVTAIWAPSHLLAVGKAGNLLMISLIAAALAKRLTKANISAEKIILPSLVIFVLFLIVTNRLTYGDFFPMRLITGRTRLFFGYNHPNESSIYVATILFFSLVAFYGSSKKKKVALLILMVAAGILLYYSGSRTSIIALFVCSFLYISLRMPTPRSRSLSVIIGSAAALVIVYLLFFLHTDNQTLGVNTNTVQSRFQLWKLAFQFMPDFNLAGNGYYSSRFYLMPLVGWAYHTHNTLIEVLFGTGIVGLLFFVAFFVSILPQILRPLSFTVGFCFLAFALLESILEVELFVPSVVMTLTCLLVYQNQFGLTGIRSGLFVVRAEDGGEHK
jgi:O-antigen ligase